MKNNYKPGVNEVVKKKEKESEKAQLASSHSNSSNNLLTSNNSHNYKIPDKLQISDHQDNASSVEKIKEKVEINLGSIQMNQIKNENDLETIRKSGVIQINRRESSSENKKKEDLLKKEANHFNSVYPSTNNNIMGVNYISNNNINKGNYLNLAVIKKEQNLTEKSKIAYEKEISSLKSVYYLI